MKTKEQKFSSCTICEKHQDLDALLLEETSSTFVSHFPVLNGSQPVLGYFLIEPKRHITSLAEMNEDEAADLGEFTVKLSRFLEEKMGAEQVYLFKIGDLVNHVHFHILPRYPNTPKEFWGLAARDYPDVKRGGLAEMAQLIKIYKT
jgi:histidine triad (HIT) family protein